MSSETQARAVVERELACWHKHVEATGCGYVQLDVLTLILRYGRYCHGQRRPTGYRCRPAANRYTDAFDLAKTAPGTMYCEGLVWSVEAEPEFRAWAIDAHRNVIDRSLRQPQLYTYFGVAFSGEEFLRLHDTCTGSVLGIGVCQGMQYVEPFFAWPAVENDIESANTSTARADRIAELMA